MKISSMRNHSIFELKKIDIDIIICASGYESRSSKYAKLFSEINAEHYCLAFEEKQKSGARIKNDNLYEKYKFKMIPLSGHNDIGAETVFLSILDNYQDKCSIIIDISSMTRAWYGAFIRTLAREERFSFIKVFFIYTPAAYYKPSLPYPPNEVVSPVRGFSGFVLPDKPVALIIGLGQDVGRAIGIKEALDPGLTVTFNADPGTDKRFLKEIERSNHQLLERIDERYKFNYPILDSISTFQEIEGLCSGLLREWSVVLVSLGPKIFGLCCFLLSVKYPDISVWRISAGTKSEIIDVHPSKQSIITEVEWKN